MARVAWLVVFAACAPTFKAPAAPVDPGPVAKPEQPRAKPTPGRQVVVGELCPQAAAGRPAVVPLIMRTVRWTDDAKLVANAVESGSVPRFAVFGTDGERAGVFDAMGLADVGIGISVAFGSYAGGSACSASAGSQRVEDPACHKALAGCGLAVAEVTRADDPPDVAVYPTGGACLSGDSLAVDIDGDGVAESFPLAALLDSIHSPAKEWSAALTAGATCTPHFQLYGVRLAAEADPKSAVMMDVLGVIDLDGDGRKELVLALHFASVRTIVVYRASVTPQRLELVGKAASFAE